MDCNPLANRTALPVFVGPFGHGVSNPTYVAMKTSSHRTPSPNVSSAATISVTHSSLGRTPKPQFMPNSTYVTKVSTVNISVSQNVNPVIRRIPAVSIIAQANNIAYQKGTHSIVTPKPQIILNPTYVTKEHHLNSRTPLSVITNSNLSNVSLNNNNGSFRKSIPSILVKPKPQIIPNPSNVPIKTSLNRAPCPNVSSAAICPALSNRNFPSSSTCTPKSNISMIANKNGIFHFATPGKLPTSMTYDIPAEHCFEEEIVDDTTVHHSGSLFVASTKKQQLPQQTDTDLLRARDSFAVCDFSNGNTSNNVSTSVEADVKDSDSSVRSIKIRRKRPINLKLKGKSDSSLKDLDDDSDSSLSDYFKKPSNSKVNKKISEKPSSFKVNTKKSSEILINDQQSISISHNDSNEEDILEILPDNYDYKILSCEVSHNEFHHIKALIRININDESEAVKWKHDFEASSKTDFRVKKTWGKLDGGGRVLYKKKFRCHHNTLAEKSGSKKPHEKHIQCPATMVNTVKNKKMQWSKDNLLKSHPREILPNGTHNHSVLGGDILRFRRPTPELKGKFTQMFTQYPPHTPSTARDAYLSDIDVDNEFALLDCVKDGAQVPSMSWLYRLYHKVYKENCGDPSGDGMISALEKYIQNYNEKCGEVCAKMGTTEDGLHNFVVVCTPLMKRVHTHLKSSGETMFIDSSGSMDRTNARIFMLITPSVVCGLPLGILMTFSEAEDVVSAALELWKTLLPEKAFFGRGMKGPKIIMTDDCPSERNSLEKSFPFAFLLLCVFHVLNAMWRYIWDSKHVVKSNHRQEIYFAFHSILYAASVDEFDELFDKALQNETISGYDLVVNHLKDLRARAKEWAVSFRSEILNRGHHTNNYAEASMKIIKDKILCRIKAFNPVQLLDHLLTRLESYYKRKIAFIINNRAEGAQRSRYSIPEEKLKPLVAEKVSSSTLYLVKNIQKNTQYLLDMDLKLCACPVGNCGATCKHQAAIAKQFGVSSHQLLPYTDVALKTILFYIMTGHTNVPPGLFDTLRGGIRKPVDLSTIPEFSEHVAFSDTAVTTSQCSKDGATTSDRAEDDIVVESSEIKLRPFFDDLVKRCDASPDVFKVTLEKFLKSYWSIVERGNYESTLSSALATFSKDQSVQTPLRRGRISNQPTAPARRTVHKGDSRTAQKGGRPRNAAVMKKPPEHGYSQGVKRKQAPRVDSWACLPKKQAKVPHSLSQCVTANVRLPK